MRQIRIFFIFLFVFWIFSFGKTEAGVEHNLTGWAWSENIGWISFNCYNDYNGDGILENHCTGAGYPSNYGVNLNLSTKIFSGYAWSENVGWITFNESELSGCPQPPCRAWLDSDNRVYGWARALAYGSGWDGWIRLRDTNYGVSLNPSTNEFEGWAWSDMVVGWISFNCKNQNSCSVSNYKVYLINQPPSATELRESFQYCNVYAGQGLMSLSWKYEDPENTNQSAYSLEVQQLIGDSWQTKVLCENISTTGPHSGGIGTSAVLIKSNPTLALCDLPSYVGDIEYGRLTRWRVKVRDGGGTWSDWTSWSTPTSTAAHAYPWIDFSWNPQKPTVGKIVQFTDLSEVYGGAKKSSWYWTFENADPSISTNQNPTTTFTSVGSNSVTLRVTDSSGFWCEKSKTVTSFYPLPFWKEIPPIFFKIRNFLASLVFSKF